MGKARAEIEVTASTSRLAAGLATAQAMFGRFAGAVARSTAKAANFGLGKFKPGKMAREAVGHFAGDMLTRGFDKVLEVAGGVRDFERSLVRFQIASNGTTASADAFRDAIHEVSIETGLSREEILGGAQTYVDLTGDVDGAKNAMRAFARIAQASGSSVSDVSAAAAALQQSMRLDPGDIEAVFSGLIEQGKKGAVSLKDFAGELSALAPRFAKFGGSGIKGIADLGSAFQIVRQGFGSASEAATGLEALMGALSLNAAKFEAAGVKLFTKTKDGRKEFRGFVDIIDAIGRSKLAKDPTALTKAMGSKEASQAFDMLTKNRDMLESIYQSGLKSDTVQHDLMTFVNSSAGKMDLAFNKMKESLIAAFTPERIEAFASMLAKAADGLNVVLEGAGRVAKFLGYKTEDERDTQRRADMTKLISGEGEQATGWRKVFGKALGVDLNAMTPQQRAEYLAKQADRIQEMPGLESFDTTKEQTLAASREYAATHGGMMLAHDDPWQQARTQSANGAPQVNISPQALAQLTSAIVGAIDRTKPTQVKIGDNQIAKSQRVATAARTRP